MFVVSRNQIQRGAAAMIKLYGFSKVNPAARGHTRDLRVLWALAEMQLPYVIVGMDHPAHDLNTEAYRRLSPFEQIPSIDDDGVNAPVRMLSPRSRLCSRSLVTSLAIWTAPLALSSPAPCSNWLKPASGCAVYMRIDLTIMGVSSGRACSIIAIVPDTTGAETLVPLIVIT
jgi:hypothetical protein